jgi:hypothetical protein
LKSADIVCTIFIRRYSRKRKSPSPRVPHASSAPASRDNLAVTEIERQAEAHDHVLDNVIDIYATAFELDAK